MPASTGAWMGENDGQYGTYDLYRAFVLGCHRKHLWRCTLLVERDLEKA